MAAKMGGPGILLVGKGSAVLLERQKGQFRVVGPGSYFIDRADRVRGTVDLRLQRGEYELDDVFTRDGIPLHIKFTVLYRIIQSEEMLIKQGRYEPDLGAVIRALLSARDWMAQTEIVARARLRDTIAEYRLDDLHAAFPQEGVSEQESFQTPRVPLQEELETRLNEEAKDWGVEIARVTLDDIRMPEEVNKQMLEAWGAHWQDIVKSQEAETEARAAKTRARGQADAFIIEARGKKNAAELAGKAMLTEARAKADASVIERRAEAEAIAEYVRRVLGAYQVGGRPLDETMLKDLLKALASLGLRVSPPSLREEGG